MVMSAGFSSKLFASIAGCLTIEYSSLMIGLQKSSIVLCLSGISAAITGVFLCVSRFYAMTSASSILTFFGFLNVLSNSVSNGRSSPSSFLCV